jgi:peroxiredoxin
MPAVELPMADGQPYQLLPGSSAVLLNFWATWCLPCRLEMKALDRACTALGPRGLRVIGISVDADAFLVREFMLGEGLKFPVLLDPEGAMARSRFRVQVYPTTFLIDSAGRIAEIWLGERDWDAPDIRKRLERVL